MGSLIWSFILLENFAGFPIQSDSALWPPNVRSELGQGVGQTEFEVRMLPTVTPELSEAPYWMLLYSPVP
jgi:hypothetical protein